MKPTSPTTTSTSLLWATGSGPPTSKGNIALKLQQLEEAMVSASPADVVTHLSYDAVHYNPLDLSTWLQSMLSEIRGPLDFDGPSPVLPAPAFANAFLPSSCGPMNFNSVLFDDSSSSDQFYLDAIAPDRGSVSGNLGASVSAPAGDSAPVPNCFAQPEEPPTRGSSHRLRRVRCPRPLALSSSMIRRKTACGSCTCSWPVHSPSNRTISSWLRL
ncbi:hypothetical protein MLD38_012356 [Melastoma candidum]|uniref:Uncharacterized protein n=1 Tax=Melastoma candidum TaxID=119954 RepID=A0ACB9R641_9MYRT|nr:hypothetical protein MLD38_012356 [Melastoma candidum]